MINFEVLKVLKVSTLLKLSHFSYGVVINN